MLIDLHAHLPHRGMLNQDPHWGPRYERDPDGDMSMTIGKWRLGLGIPERRKALAAGKLDDLETSLARRSNPEVRINQMNAENIDAMVLSMPAHMGMYHTELDFAERFADTVNTVMQDYCSSHPDRLYFWAHAPLQAPDVAAKTLARAVKDRGAVGLGMGGANFGGLEVDDSEMDVLWKTCCDLGVPLFVHGMNQSVTWGDRAADERYEITSIVGMMYDETSLFWNMICGGVLDRFPDLKIYITHAGGYVPYHLGRFEITNSVLKHAKNKRPLREYLPNFYFDMLTHDMGMRRAIFDSIGADRLLYGSNFGGSDGIREDLTSGINLDEADRNKIRYENAIKLLGITPGRAVKVEVEGELQRAL